MWAYYQQEVNYKIDVKLNTESKTLSAFEQITYINHSPDTLRKIYFHLWPNAYQSGTDLARQLKEDGNTFLYFSEEGYLGKIDSLSFSVDNQTAELQKTDKKDIAILQLNAPLLPGDSIFITTPFRVQIPYGEVSRLGHLDSSFQITQWYPKPAVYDGEWHAMPYLNQGEFFSEFGNFEVAIEYPNNYQIAATGDLSDISKTKNTTINTYKIENVHDFAWFADKHWIIEESKIKLPNSGRIVKTYTKYRPENADIWRNSVKDVDSAIYYYSLWVGDYPYSVCTAVDGGLTAGAGMEYPTITVLGGEATATDLEQVIIHEVGHNWFYGILGSNEREHPWMDEGINSYYERRYYEEVNPSNFELKFNLPLTGIKLLDIAFPNKNLHHYNHDYSNSRALDIPINLSANSYSSINYGSIIYSKSAVAFNYLEKYLGKSVFDECMREYYQEWQFKHPSPDVLAEIFKRNTSKNLDWFFEDLLKTSYPIDYKINFAGYNYANDSFSVVVSNIGDIASPLVISALNNGEVVKTVWYDGFWDKKELIFPYGNYDEIIIDYHHDIPEINRKNNRFEVFNVLGQLEPLEAAFIFNTPKPEKTQIFFAPIAGYNNHDQLQLGLAAYNLGLIERPFRYLLMPQFSFGTNRLVGLGQLTYSMYPAEYFRKINVNFEYRRQGLNLGVVPGQTQKIEAGLNFVLNKKSDRSKLKSNIEARLTNASVSFDRRDLQYKNYITFDYNVENKKTINPYEGNIRLQTFDQNWKLQGEFKYSLTINKRLQSIDVRGFAGYFLQNVDAGRERFRVTAGNGTLIATDDLEQFDFNTHDYLFDEVMLGRFISNGVALARQQVYIDDAGFKSGINTGFANEWMGAVNITIPTPLKFLSIYSDFGIFDSVWDDFQSDRADSPIFYDYGLQLNIAKNYFEIYLPLGYSNQIENNYDINGADTFTQRIKFMVNMNKLYDIIQ